MKAIERTMSQVAHNLEAVLSEVGGMGNTPEEKRRRKGGTGEKENGDANAADRECSLPPRKTVTTEMLDRALRRTAEAVTTIMAEEVAEVERRVKAVEEEHSKLTRKVDATAEALQSTMEISAQGRSEVDHRMAEHEKCLAAHVAQVAEQTVMLQQLTQRMAAMEASPKPAAATASQAASPGSSPSGRPPQSQLSEEELSLRSRTARIGNIGWDATPDLLLERARKLLDDCNMKDGEHYSCLTAAVYRQAGTGSACECIFKTSEDLVKAKYLVTGLSRVHPGCSSHAWVDKKKQREELVASRVLTALYNLVRTAESRREQKGVVERSQISKAIMVDGLQLFGVSTNGDVTAGHGAFQRYGEATVRDLIGWASASR